MDWVRKDFFISQAEMDWPPAAEAKNDLFGFALDSSVQSLRTDADHNAFLIKTGVDSLYYFDYNKLKIYASKISKTIPKLQFSFNFTTTTTNTAVGTYTFIDSVFTVTTTAMYGNVVKFNGTYSKTDPANPGSGPFLSGTWSQKQSSGSFGLNKY
jgi:hypothetical protein